MKYLKIKNEEIKEELKKSVNNDILAQLLANRGISTKEDVEEFLNPETVPLIDPFCFSDMQKAILRIENAISNKEKILIWGDFDSDGVTSTALLYKTLKIIGANVIYFIPDRQTLGHGLNTRELIKFVSKEKVKLLITVDCGISDNKTVDFLNNFKVDTIITDHHKTENELPNAYAILNPQAKGCIQDIELHKIRSLCNLAGVGVAYKLVLGLLKNHKELEQINDELLCLTALGTISDVVPLKGENRVLVKLGLEKINQAKHKGISLILNNNLKGKEATSEDIAFVVTPRINASGRLDSPYKALELLLEENENKLNDIVEFLNTLNSLRQEMCALTYEDILSEIEKNPLNPNDKAVILINPNWHIGIIGIVASKVVENFHKPAFLMTIDDKNKIRCSIRSPMGYDVYKVLKELSDNFEGFGGHALAGGFSLPYSEENFKSIKEKILKTFDELYPETPDIYTQYAEMELKPQQINKELLDTVSYLEPFGEQNEKPLFYMSDTNYISHRFMGQENNHLRLECVKDGVGLRCVKWFESNFTPPKNKLMDILFFPKLNVFNGEETIQLELIDYDKMSDKKGGLKIFDHRGKENIENLVDDYLAKVKNPTLAYVNRKKTVDLLQKFKNIKKNFYTKNSKGDLMFFDYPPSFEDFIEIIKNSKAQKIHIFKSTFEEEIDFYIRQTVGMLKYCENNKITADIEKIANALYLDCDFVRIFLEILTSENIIKFEENCKPIFLKSCSFETVKQNELYETLKEHFDKIIDFKKHLKEDDIKDIEEIISSL